MAHHNNTPRTVLLADQPRTPVVVSAQNGRNRHDRRHVPLNEKGRPIPVAASFTIPKAARKAATNIPFIAVPS